MFIVVSFLYLLGTIVYQYNNSIAITKLSYVASVIWRVKDIKHYYLIKNTYKNNAPINLYNCIGSASVRTSSDRTMGT